MSKKRFALQLRSAITGIGPLLFLFAGEVAKGEAPQAPKPSPTPESSQSPPGDLTQVSIENLKNVEINSASKREQSVSSTVLNDPRGS